MHFRKEKFAGRAGGPGGRVVPPGGAGALGAAGGAERRGDAVARDLKCRDLLSTFGFLPINGTACFRTTFSKQTQK